MSEICKVCEKQPCECTRIEKWFDKALKFPLAGWQRDHLKALFETKKNGRRQFRTSYWALPKKNGKSSIAAGIALYGLLADEEPHSHVYLAASTRDQATIVFRHAKQLLESSELLKERCKVIDSTKTIIDRENPTSFLRAVSADAGTQDGVEPHFCIFDEVHRQKGEAGRDLWSVLKKGQHTRREPLMFAITTAGVASETPLCWELHEYALGVKNGVFKDPSFYPVIYSLDEDADWTDEDNWRDVNPAAGDIEKEADKFKNIQSMREEFEIARRSPAAENAFRRFELNQWVAQETRWIQLAEWDQADLFDMHSLVGRQCWAGLDLSTTTDVTALVLVFPFDDHFCVLPFFWLPEETINERTMRESVPYRNWARQGLLELTPGNAIDYRYIYQHIKELTELYNFKEIAIDPWNATQVSIDLENEGYTVVPVRQGYASMTTPSRAFERAVLAHKIRHNGHPVLRWMVDCVSLKQDPTGNIKPVKPDRLKSNKRIDGVVALIMGLDRTIRHQAEAGFVYERRGLRSI